MFKTRFLSGAVLTLIMIAVLYFGGYVTGVFVFALSILGVIEVLRIYDLHKKAPGVLVYVFTTLYYALLFLNLDKYIVPLIVVFVLAQLITYVVTTPKYKDINVAAAVLSFFYVTVMLSYMYQIRVLEHGGAFVVMIFICSWINDTCAYLVGVKFGKHKMTPKLSPKKSVEGLIGGIAGATLFGALYGIFINAKVFELENAAVIFAIVGGLGAGMAVLGDLTASAIKRNNDLKDYGKLIPGHGGVMDRFDSIIFTAPIIYYLLLFMTGNLGG